MDGFIKYHGKKLASKLIKLIFLVGCIFIALEFAASTQGVLDIDQSKGQSENVFKNKVFSAALNVPKKFLTWVHVLPERIEYSSIPKEVLEVFSDLEKRLNDSSVSPSQKTNFWRLSKVKETSLSFGLSEEEVMEIYVKVKTSINFPN